MPARSIWNGSLDVGGYSLPVKVYAAIQDVAVHFNLLHDSDLTRLKQRWAVAPANEEGATEASDASEGAPRVQKGYPLQDGTYVLLHEAELEQIVPDASRSIELRTFVPLSAIEPVWYLRPYYLGPNGLNEDYSALAHVLEELQLAGVARWVMRKRAYHGALLAVEGHLMLHTLRNRAEVLVAPKVITQSRAFDARELKMADQLIDAMVGQFDPSAFEDHHRQMVLDLIENKAAGLPTKRSAPGPGKRDATPLADALERSLLQFETKQPRAKQPKPPKERRSA